MYLGEDHINERNELVLRVVGGGMPVKDNLDQVSSLTVRRVLEFPNNKSSIRLWCAHLSFLHETVDISDIYSNFQVLNCLKLN